VQGSLNGCFLSQPVSGDFIIRLYLFAWISGLPAANTRRVSGYVVPKKNKPHMNHSFKPDI